MNKATIYDVAALARVSNATVSRALNESDKVKPETRERVLKAAKELGYKANAFAKGLASSKSTEVAVVVSDLARASVAEMVKGISEVASHYNYSILLFTDTSDDKLKDLLTNLVSHQVDGVLYLNDEVTSRQNQLLEDITSKYQIPLVLCNTISNSNFDFLSVSIDFEKAGYEVTKSLIQEGRKKIALFTTSKRYPVSELKEAGYKKAIKEFGLEEFICYTSGNLDTNKAGIEEFLSNNDIDGVIGVRDSIAIAVLNALIRKGRKIPEEISVYGFQNTRYTQLSRPLLSTINIPIYEIGARAMRVLTTEMAGEEQERKGRIILEHSIIKRETTR